MPSVTAVAVFFVLTLGCAQWVVAKEDGVPDRRVGGGTRLEIPGKLPHTIDRSNADQDCDRRDPARTVATIEGATLAPIHLWGQFHL